MIERVTIRPKARLDLLEQFVYLGDAALIDLAERFAEAVAATCARRRSPPARLEGLHFSPVQEFEKYLVFYLPSADGIDVIRILHSARDVARVLESERR